LRTEQARPRFRLLKELEQKKQKEKRLNQRLEQKRTLDQDGNTLLIQLFPTGAWTARLETPECDVRAELRAFRREDVSAFEQLLDFLDTFFEDSFFEDFFEDSFANSFLFFLAAFFNVFDVFVSWFVPARSQIRTDCFHKTKRILKTKTFKWTFWRDWPVKHAGLAD
jgi:hypothetical protein